MTDNARTPHDLATKTVRDLDTAATNNTSLQNVIQDVWSAKGMGSAAFKAYKTEVNNLLKHDPLLHDFQLVDGTTAPSKYSTPVHEVELKHSKNGKSVYEFWGACGMDKLEDSNHKVIANAGDACTPGRKA